MRIAGVGRFGRGIGRSVAGAAFLLVVDGVFGGSCMLSVLACPVWFLISLIGNSAERPGWGLALVRIGMPALTLAALRVNAEVQLEVAEVHARQVIAACERYRADRGAYPKTLDELVPAYFDSVPVAKHCLGRGRDFFYYNSGGSPSFFWYVFGFYRKTYDFESRRWGHVD